MSTAPPFFLCGCTKKQQLVLSWSHLGFRQLFFLSGEIFPTVLSSTSKWFLRGWAHHRHTHYSNACVWVNIQNAISSSSKSFPWGNWIFYAVVSVFWAIFNHTFQHYTPFLKVSICLDWHLYTRPHAVLHLFGMSKYWNSKHWKLLGNSFLPSSQQSVWEFVLDAESSLNCNFFPLLIIPQLSRSIFL